MITKTQQHIIDSITNEFERINNIQSGPISQLAQRIKGEISEYDSNQDEFRFQTETYELANTHLFEDICLQIEDLCNELGLEFKSEADKVTRYGYTSHRSVEIVFPNLFDNTRAYGKVSIRLSVTPLSTKEYGIYGLEDIGLEFQQYSHSPKICQNKVLEFIAEEIIETHKRYSK